MSLTNVGLMKKFVHSSGNCSMPPPMVPNSLSVIAVVDQGAGPPGPPYPIFEAPDYILRPKLHILGRSELGPPGQILDPLLHTYILPKSHDVRNWHPS